VERPRKYWEIVNPPPLVSFFFRRRTFFLLLCCAALMVVARPQAWSFAVGLILAALGAALRVWASGTLRKTRRLTTGGPYAWVRHPLYAGSFLLAVGYCFMSGRVESFVIGLPIFFLLHHNAVGVEEEILSKLYGEEYRRYCRRVPRYLPRGRPVPPTDGGGEFDWRQVAINREHLNLIWVALVCLFFAGRLMRAW